MFEQLQFLADRTAAETPAQALARQAREAEQRADRQAAQDEAARDVALEEAAETRAFTFRQLNVQPGAALAEALRRQDEDQQYDAARSVMEKIDRRRESRRKAAEYQAEQLAEASRARSGQPAGLEHANELAARLRVEQMLTGPARSRGRRPFAVRSAGPGDLGRVTCEECIAVGASETESFMIHHEEHRPVPDDFTPEMLAQVNRETGRHRPQQSIWNSGQEIRRGNLGAGAGAR